MLHLNFSPFPVLQTERLILRQVSQEDIDEIFYLRTNEEVNKYIYRPQPKTKEIAKQFIDKITNALNNNESIVWGITLKGIDKIIGTIVFWNIEPENDQAEIGYTLGTAYQHKGIMSEAFKAVVEHGINNYKFKTITAYTHQDNEPSINLLLKHHFQRDQALEKIKIVGDEPKTNTIYRLDIP